MTSLRLWAGSSSVSSVLSRCYLAAKTLYCKNTTAEKLILSPKDCHACNHAQQHAVLPVRSRLDAHA